MIQEKDCDMFHRSNLSVFFKYMVFVAAVILLAACGGGASPGGQSADTNNTGDISAGQNAVPPEPGNEEIESVAQAIQILDPFLLAHWSLDSDTAVPDVSGHGLDGIIVGSPTLAVGRVGSALQFKKTAHEYIAIEDSPAFSPSQLTLALWVKVQSTGGYIVAKGTKGASKQFVLQPSWDGYAVYLKSDAGTASLEKIAPVQLGLWQHIAVTWDNQTVRVYLDGVEKASAPLLGSRIHDDQTPLHLGTDRWKTSFFDGALDDIRLYDKALTTDDISAFINGSHPPDNQPPVATVTATPTTSNIQVEGSQPTPLPGTGLYVSTVGSDTNPGTQAAPFASIQQAIDIAVPGTTVHVAQGTYQEHLTIGKAVSVVGGYHPTTWERDFSTYVSVIDGRFFSQTKPDTLRYTIKNIERTTVFDGFTLYGPVISDPERDLIRENDGATITTRGNETFRNLIVYGPKKNDKIYTVFVGGTGSTPLFSQFTLYGGEGNGGFSKVEIIGTWRTQGEFIDGEIFPGRNVTGSHRFLVEGGAKIVNGVVTLTAHTKFTRVTFHAAAATANPSASQFLIADYLMSPLPSGTLYSEFYDCIFFGANAGKTQSDILRLQSSNGNTVNFAKYVLSGNHFILGTSTGESPNNFSSPANIDMLIAQAGGVFQNTHFWNSLGEYISGTQ